MGQPHQDHQHLRIVHHWNGKPLSSELQSTIEIHPDKTHWTLSIDCPWLQNPKPDVPAGPCPGLWNHEVIELFIAHPDGPYLELEFGPWEHYLALAFSEPRVPQKGAELFFDHEPLVFERILSEQRYTVQAKLPTSWLPGDPSESYKLNAFWMADLNGKRAYACVDLMRPNQGPDFHQPHLFKSQIRVGSAR